MTLRLTKYKMTILICSLSSTEHDVYSVYDRQFGVKYTIKWSMLYCYKWQTHSWIHGFRSNENKVVNIIIIIYT